MLKAVLELFKRFAVLGSPRGDAPPTKICPGCGAIMRPPRCELCRYEEQQYHEITLADYLMGRDEDPRYRAEFCPEYRAAARILLDRANRLCSALKSVVPGMDRPQVRSGWRPSIINAQAGGRPASKHLICQAIDISDPSQELARHLMGNPHLLQEFDLAMEHPSATLTWCHLQFPPPPSGNRIFKP